MVLDTSAVLALLQNEPDAEQIEDLLADSLETCIASPTVLECSIVLEKRYGLIGAEKLDALMRDAEVEVVAFDAALLEVARAAFRRFGRGRHPAKLNYGDCFSYALAKHRGEPLLFKGEDFAQTDIEAARG